MEEVKPDIIPLEVVLAYLLTTKIESQRQPSRKDLLQALEQFLERQGYPERAQIMRVAT